MPRTRASIAIELAPDRAFALWADVRRWPTFIDDFASVESLDPEWPANGAKLVWVSKPRGRGRVTQKVIASEPPFHLQTLIFEDKLTGTLAASFESGEGGGSIFDLELEYTLAQTGPLAPITDLLFIRRALRDSLNRTCARFAREASEEASL
jgi:Polyketide cyclase / dehydrase and lipid transport